MYRIEEEIRHAHGKVASDTLVKVCTRGGSTALTVYLTEPAAGSTDGLGQTLAATTFKSDGQGRVRCFVDTSQSLDIVAVSLTGAEIGRTPVEPFTAALERQLTLTLGSQWATYFGAAGFHSVGSYRTSEGRVFLTGALQAVIAGYSTTILTLPSRHCPQVAHVMKTLVFAASPFNTYGIANITVAPSGAVTIANPSLQAGGWVTLDGVHFQVQQ